MSQLEISRIVAQIRDLRAQAGLNVAPQSGGDNNSSVSFAAVLKSGLDQVNSQQLRAGDLAKAFERGIPGVELSQVMLEMQKANVGFRAATEVRNRLVGAYQEIMNMPV